MIKGITYEITLSLIKKIFALILPEVSNHIRQLLEAYLKELYKKAIETENVFDDYFVKLLADVLGIKLEE